AKNDLGDAVDANDKEFGDTFPYLANPTEGSRGPLAKGVDSGNDVRNQLGDALRPAGAAGSDDTTLIAASAGAGAGGILLIGVALMWWRRMRGRAYCPAPGGRDHSPAPPTGAARPLPSPAARAAPPTPAPERVTHDRGEACLRQRTTTPRTTPPAGPAGRA